MKIVIIDNYDSFVYNLSHAIKELGAEVTVKRKRPVSAGRTGGIRQRFCCRPVPGVPEEAGLLLDVIRTYAGKKPILGVCLGETGHRRSVGGKLTNLDEGVPRHTESRHPDCDGLSVRRTSLYRTGREGIIPG